MRRDVVRLAEEEFDVLVVGGGVLGAFAARDAALRGLRTALLERADFGAGTSANSLRIAHGGLRYLQRLDVRRMRESARERGLWLRLAPHLVEPLPILVPARGLGRESRLLLRLALAVTERVAPGGDEGLPPDRRLPPARALGLEECLCLAPVLEGSPCRGGVLFHDALFYSPERVVLAAVRAAAEEGAAVANYLEAGGMDRRRGGLTVAALDRLGGAPLRIRCRTVLNAAGSASGAVAARMPDVRPPTVAWSVAYNLVAPGRGERVALGLRAATGRYLFFVPWRGRLCIGTGHAPFSGDPARFGGEVDRTRFLEEVNAAWPGGPFTADDILLAQAGLLPASPEASPGRVRLLDRPILLDHGREGFPEGVTAIGVKFTTARRLAARAVDVLGPRCGVVAPSRGADAPLPGTPRGSVAELVKEARSACAGTLDPDVAEHLARTYGTAYPDVLSCAREDPEWNRRLTPEAPVIRAQLAYAARHEMAATPEDVVWRRTELGPCGLATQSLLRTVRTALERESGAPCAASAE